jgi:hypothetical protein
MCCKKKEALLWNQNLSDTVALFIIFMWQKSWLTELVWVKVDMKLHGIFPVQKNNCLCVVYQRIAARIHVNNYVVLILYLPYLLP